MTSVWTFLVFERKGSLEGLLYCPVFVVAFKYFIVLARMIPYSMYSGG